MKRSALIDASFTLSLTKSEGGHERQECTVIENAKAERKGHRGARVHSIGWNIEGEANGGSAPVVVYQIDQGPLKWVCVDVKNARVSMRNLRAACFAEKIQDGAQQHTERNLSIRIRPITSSLA